MKRKSWIIILSAAALIVICVSAWFANAPISEPQSSEQPYNGGVIVDIAPYLDIHDIEEYYDFVVTEKNLPDNFVTADMLSGFGNFDAFICEESFDSGYAYILEDNDGANINFHIIPKEEKEVQEKETLDVSKAKASMRRLTTQDTGVILRNGVKYHYSLGKLSGIEWKTDDLTFRIWFSYPSKEYTAIAPDSVLSRMLSSSDADLTSALNEMSAIVSQNDHVTE